MTNSEARLSGKKRKLLIAVWILAMIGLAVSIELTRIYYEYRRDLDFTPFCAISEQVNCVSVALSKYATVLDIPNSIYGMAAYMLILVLVPFRLRSGFRIFAHLENYLALLAIFSFLFSLYLAAVSTFILKTVCIWCSALYLINTAFLVLILLSLDWPRKVVTQFASDFELLRTAPRILGGFLAVVILAMVFIVIQLNRSSRIDIVPTGDNAPVDINISKDPSLGPANASVTIIEFSDFQCPYCREMHFVLKKMREKFGPRIRIVYKNFPLDPDCNSGIKFSLHPGSCVLAYAAECAFQSGCFESFYDKLIQINIYNMGSLLQLAIDCGIDPNEFQACMTSTDPKKAVSKDIDDALKVRIEATPTLVINGRILQGMRSDKEMERIIKAALQGRQIPENK